MSSQIALFDRRHWFEKFSDAETMCEQSVFILLSRHLLNLFLIPKFLVYICGDKSQ